MRPCDTSRMYACRYVNCSMVIPVRGIFPPFYSNIRRLVVAAVLIVLILILVALFVSYSL